MSISPLLKTVACSTLILLLIIASYAAWKHFAPVSSNHGFSYSVLHENIDRVSALAIESNGNLLASQEYKKNDGVILRFSKKTSPAKVFNTLFKPDGMVSYRKGVAISQEGHDKPVLWLHDDKVDELFNGHGIEQVATDGYYLFAIEDQDSGRLLRFDPQTKELLVLRKGLNEAEAVTVCPDGRIFYSEKSQGTVKKLGATLPDEIIWSGLNEPGFLACNNEGLWVTEDATHMARLLLRDHQGSVRIILNHLRSPQTFLVIASGQYLLAEQGRNRILSIHR